MNNIAPEEVEALVKRGATVLDVRTKEEYNAGHIDGATNIDFYDPTFKDNIAALDKSNQYVVHCKGGGRSSKTVAMMGEMGFMSSCNMLGGIDAWKEKGLPVVG